VLQLHESLANLFKRHPSKLVQFGFINGLPGFVTLESDDVLQTTALELEAGKIVRVYIMRNPDKLRHLSAADPDAH
jgi:RNA polymerase sigma-70 factor (ECF subfamily)